MTNRVLMYDSSNKGGGLSLFIGLIFFYIWMTIFAIFVYQQFDSDDVVLVSLLFLLVIGGITYFFNRDKLKFSLANYPREILFAIVIFIVLFLISDLPPFWIKELYPTYPLIQADLGFHIHRDSIYHVSLIQSILNLGYPSTGQHDTPLIIYHVLSYYVDAFILLISGLEAYDSYGLFFHFKAFSLFSVISVFCWRVTQGFSNYVLVLSIFIMGTIISGTWGWQIIGSHSLWFTSLLIIVSFHKVFEITIKKSLTSWDFLFLFFILILISTGKISSGFMYSVFLGFFLLFKFPKDYRVYILGIFLSFFYILYLGTVSDSGGQSAPVFPSVQSVFYFLYEVLDKYIYYFVVLLFLSLIVVRGKKIYFYLFSAIVSFFVLGLIIESVSYFSRSDIRSFVYGLQAIFVLLLFELFFYCVKTSKVDEKNRSFNYFSNKVGVSITLILFLLVSFSYMFKVVNMFPNGIKGVIHHVNAGRFLNINSILDDEAKISLKRLIAKKIDFSPALIDKSDTSLSDFRDSLYRFMEEKNINKANSLLFISEEIMISNLKSFDVRGYARGMMIYAVGGVPLLHGAGILRRTYGYSDYDKSALWKSTNDFDLYKACKYNKNIVKVEKWKPLAFSLEKCK